MNKVKSEQLYNIIKEVLRVKATEDLSMVSVPSWDSLRHIQLLARIQQVFSIEFDFEDTLNMTTLKAIKEAIEKYSGGGQKAD